MFQLNTPSLRFYFFFFFNDTATTEIYTLSLHDALPISRGSVAHGPTRARQRGRRGPRARSQPTGLHAARRHEPAVPGAPQGRGLPARVPRPGGPGRGDARLVSRSETPPAARHRA